MDREEQTLLTWIGTQLQRIAYALEQRYAMDDPGPPCSACGCTSISTNMKRCPACQAALKGATDVSGG